MIDHRGGPCDTRNVLSWVTHRLAKRLVDEGVTSHERVNLHVTRIGKAQIDEIPRCFRVPPTRRVPLRGNHLFNRASLFGFLAFIRTWAHYSCRTQVRNYLGDGVSMFLLLQKRDRFFKSFINKAVSQLVEQADKFLSHADVETKRRDDASWEKSCVNCRPEILLSLLFINLSYRNRAFFENLLKRCI